MRVLIVHEAAAGGGGVESYLASLMPALAARGHDLAFLHHNTAAEQGPTRLDSPGMPSASVADRGLHGAMDWVSGWRPDVCFSHNMRHLEVDERLASAWPVAKMLHGYFGTCVSGLKAHAFPSLAPCSRTFGGACLALYLPRRCGRLRPETMFAGYAWASRQQALFSKYARLVVASEHMGREYARNGAPRDRLTVAPLFPTGPGADPDARRRTPGSDPAGDAKQTTVLFAGRMTAIKGVDLLVRAVAVASARLRTRVRLIMAGEGPERERLDEVARSLGVDISFPGWVSAAALADLFRSAAVVAVPSLWPEPFGLVGLEAGAFGVPAIAFDVGGIPEWLHDGVNGRLVGGRSAEAFGRTLAEMLGDAAALGSLAAGAAETAAAFTIDAHLDTIERVLQLAVSPDPRPVPSLAR
jgi:glycosyltransferase involved in cell wall biosynthesis